MSFYGNSTINNLLQFDKIYSSRKDMNDAIASSTGDEVFLNRCVLVKYDEDNYENCLEKDGGTNYDGTVWKKVSKGQTVEYVLIAHLIPSFLVWHTF